MSSRKEKSRGKIVYFIRISMKSILSQKWSLKLFLCEIFDSFLQAIK